MRQLTRSDIRNHQIKWRNEVCDLPRDKKINAGMSVEEWKALKGGLKKNCYDSLARRPGNMEED